MSIELLHKLWEYHHWASRRLSDVTAALGSPPYSGINTYLLERGASPRMDGR